MEHCLIEIDSADFDSIVSGINGRGLLRQVARCENVGLIVLEVTVQKQLNFTGKPKNSLAMGRCKEACEVLTWELVSRCDVTNSRPPPSINVFGGVLFFCKTCILVP